MTAALTLTGCAHRMDHARPGSAWLREAPTETYASSLTEIQSLKASLSALAPIVREEEAQLAAQCAIEYSRQLAEEYRVVRPPLLHNFLVNMRLKKRGLCFQWAEDLLAQLRSLNLTTLDLHWGIARAGTPREHNSVVITAHGEPFEHGLVLDPWRRSGHLSLAPVVGDKYPWEEGELDPSASSP